MNLRFLEIAVGLWAEAIEFYDAKTPGLGGRFSNEIRWTLERIRSFPNAWTTIAPHTRRCLVSHFPFGIYYQVRPDHILIISVFDQRKKPREWQAWYTAHREQKD